MSLCKQCIEGTTWEGEPIGKVEKIGDVDVYVSLAPEGSGDKTKALLYLPDVFSLKLVNNKLLADDYARAGYNVYAIDVLEGDGWEKNELENKEFDFGKFLAKHNKERVEGTINPVIEHLRKQGVKSFAAAGFCFGGRYVTNYAVRKEIDVGILCHPSLLETPKDLEDIKQSGVPTYWATCETDGQFGPERQQEADKILGGGKMESEDGKYSRSYYKGASHGFAVRSDPSVEEQRFAKEDSFKQALAFLKKHF